MKKRIFPLTLSALLASTHAFAAEDDSCRNGFFPGYQGEYHQAEIRAGAGQVHFYDDMDGCPEKGESCARKAYLVPGNTVLVAQTKPGWSCVWYFAKKRDFTSWIPSASLTAIPTRAVREEDWLGQWLPVEGNNAIVISHHGDKLHVSGSADWHGGTNSYGEEVVHIGEIDDDATVKANRLTFGIPDSTKYECGGEMLLINGNLVVRDNSNCGGMNVRFDSVYRKVSQTKQTH
ncbi:hypothetical protein ABEH87_00240 [Erwinia sp. Eh17-17]|uniref:hypothetical protein n=1 Tax=Erwinia sp. Eh17-17 TaxID=3080330 RepID=UPI00320AFD31